MRRKTPVRKTAGGKAAVGRAAVGKGAVGKTAVGNASTGKPLKRSQQYSRLVSYLMHHLQMLIASLGYLSRQPFSSLMTSAVIAIALALPAGLYIALDNVSRLSAGWNGTTQISLFLKTGTSIRQTEQLAKKLRLYPQIDKVRVIDRDTGLQQFQQISSIIGQLKPKRI